mmetsp:Transcript_141327/g.367938  ORF Transcript_141327/g.367938 Transcript_141327/m.367938 type:complete len:333 (-) Transcript_141327:21-1019(-)
MPIGDKPCSNVCPVEQRGEAGAEEGDDLIHVVPGLCGHFPPNLLEQLTVHADRHKTSPEIIQLVPRVLRSVCVQPLGRAVPAEVRAAEKPLAFLPLWVRRASASLTSWYSHELVPIVGLPIGATRPPLGCLVEDRWRLVVHAFLRRPLRVVVLVAAKPLAPGFAFLLLPACWLRGRRGRSSRLRSRCSTGWSLCWRRNTNQDLATQQIALVAACNEVLHEGLPFEVVAADELQVEGGRIQLMLCFFVLLVVVLNEEPYHLLGGTRSVLLGKGEPQRHVALLVLNLLIPQCDLHGAPPPRRPPRHAAPLPPATDRPPRAPPFRALARGEGGSR